LNNLAETSIEKTEGLPSDLRQSQKPKKTLTLLVLVFLMFIGTVGGIWLYNETILEKPLEALSVKDPRNSVVIAHAHFDGWINPQVVVFDITNVSDNATRLDVFRVLLAYSEALKEQRFDSVILSARGRKKFVIEGAYFQQIGQEYSRQNPMYTIRTFPLHLTAMDGSKPFSEYSGGIFAVLGKEMEQFKEFHDKWYLEDFAAEGK
jgi:hypothetical protein